MMNTNEKVTHAVNGEVILGSILVEDLREADKKLTQSFPTKKTASSTAKPPLLMKFLGNRCSPSVIIGGSVGIVAICVSLYAAHTGKLIKKPEIQKKLFELGRDALSNAFVMSLIPTPQWSNAIEDDQTDLIGYNPKPTLNPNRIDNASIDNSKEKRKHLPLKSEIL